MKWNSIAENRKTYGRGALRGHRAVSGIVTHQGNSFTFGMDINDLV